MITRRLSNIISNLCPVLLVVCLVWLVFNYRRNDRAQKQMAFLIERQVELENKVYEYRSKEAFAPVFFRHLGGKPEIVFLLFAKYRVHEIIGNGRNGNNKLFLPFPVFRCKRMKNSLFSEDWQLV